MQPVKIKAALFDIDGTLVDSVDLHAQAWQEAFRHFGRAIPFEEVRHQIGKGGDQLMPVFFSKEELHEFGDEMETYRRALYKRKYLPQVLPFPQVRELFQRIHADGIRIALASSAKEDELTVYKQMLHIEDLLAGETSADDVTRSKPHPDIFKAALDQVGGPRPDEAIAVGDTPYDAQAAGKLHVRTIGLLCGGFPEAELRAAGCITIFRDPADLLVEYEASPLTAHSAAYPPAHPLESRRQKGEI